MLYFRTTNKALPEIAHLTIDESNRAGYGEILNGNKLSTSERKLAQRQGEYIRANITVIERNRR